MRDLLIGAPVFWVHENATLLICFGAAIAAWLLPSGVWKGKALLWLDAAGLAAYATFGAAKGLAFGLAPLPAFGDGRAHRLPRRHRPRRARRRALDPDAPRALRHRRRAVGASALVGLTLAGMPGAPPA